MRFPRIKEMDGSWIAAECELCGGEIGGGEACYRVNGQIFCEDCLPDYARRYFASCRWEGGEERW